MQSIVQLLSLVIQRESIPIEHINWTCWIFRYFDMAAGGGGGLAKLYTPLKLVKIHNFFVWWDITKFLSYS